jgi:hypothetical protein
MRLKEIKPGMVIHCKTLEEMEQAIEHYKIDEDASLIWNYKSSLDDERRDCLQFNESGNYTGFCSREYFEGEGYTITEFSDLILPEMTADELLNILNEIIHCGVRRCDECPLAENGETLCTNDKGGVKISNPDKLISICQQWKSEHEKKEPEIETVDICRIIEIQPDGKKRCVHEEDISDGELMYSGDAVENCRYILKNYCKEHDGEFIAVHEVVSRVKAVE